MGSIKEAQTRPEVAWTSRCIFRMHRTVVNSVTIEFGQLERCTFDRLLRALAFEAVGIEP
jgi:hypothetical protein